MTPEELAKNLLSVDPDDLPVVWIAAAAAACMELASTRKRQIVIPYDGKTPLPTSFIGFEDDGTRKATDAALAECKP